MNNYGYSRNYNYYNNQLPYYVCNGRRCIEQEVRPHPNAMTKTSFTTEEAIKIAKDLNIDFNKAQFDIEQFRMGLDVELEHGLICPHTNVTSNNPIMTGKITLIHLFELPDYYTRLKQMEKEGEIYWKGKTIYKDC